MSPRLVENRRGSDRAGRRLGSRSRRSSFPPLRDPARRRAQAARQAGLRGRRLALGRGLYVARRGRSHRVDDRPRRAAAVRSAGSAWRRPRAVRPPHVPAVRPVSAAPRRRRRDREDRLDVELAERPPAARSHEWMLRIEAAIFASARPVPREALVRLVGQDCRDRKSVV